MVLILAGWSLYALVERSLLAEVDRALIAKARLLSSMVEQLGDELNLEFVETEMSEFLADEHSAFLQVSLARGDVLYRSPTLGEHTLDLGAVSDAPTVAWTELPTHYRGRKVTLYFEPELGQPADPAVKRAKLALVVARDAREVDRALATLRERLLIVGLATLAIAAGVLVWVVRRSVRPLAGVASRIAEIGEDDLSTRLEVSGVPTELVPVVRRANDLLARLEAAFARERAFADDVAHELRTPLAGLLTTLEVTATRPRNEADYARALADSARIVRQLQTMVERLLHLARLAAGPPEPETSGYDPAELAVEAWEPFAPQALARGLRVDLHFEDGLRVTVNRELLALILRNLNDNAVTYAEPGGRVGITLRRSAERQVCFEVSNSGSRLDSEQASAATRRFWRGDPARTETGLHCGLGLALVDKATRALGGSLELSSRVDGNFVAQIVLPVDGSA
jgi:two-component system, OmpR family, heavy metal sensor histidine kinase CusS